MPEGHTIHRAARDHTRYLAGQTLRVSSPQGRFDTTPLVARGTRLVRVDAHGKHLFYVFERGTTLHVHLGLFGKFYRRRSPAPPPRATTRLRLEGDAITVDLVGPTACELLTPKQKATLLARLGPDPLRDDASPATFFEHVGRSKSPIGALLMDQSVIAGVGNVYRAEVLHLLRVHPDKPARELPRETLEAMWQLLVGLLRRGVEEGRIVTTHGFTIARPKKRILRAESVFVYRRTTCRSCGGDVARYTLRARVAYVCPHCQPL